jgi:hypothetical protein
MSKQIAIQGADVYATNVSGNNYVSTLQVCTARRSKLHKVVVSVIGAADVYLWAFDLTTGSISSKAPRIVILCPGGACTTLDLSTGKPFVNGIFLALSSTKPGDANTAPADAGNNAAILDVDYRLE